MYGAGAVVLSLEQLTDANKLLSESSKEFEGAMKESTAELPSFLAQLPTVDDSRYGRRRRGAEQSPDGIGRGGRSGDREPMAGDALRADLRRRDRLTGPDLAAVTAAVGHLRDAMAVGEDVRAMTAEDAWQQAELLERAVERHRGRTAGPVCGSDGQLEDV
jgi:hypothetical protein